MKTTLVAALFLLLAFAWGMRSREYLEEALEEEPQEDLEESLMESMTEEGKKTVKYTCKLIYGSKYTTKEECIYYCQQEYILEVKTDTCKRACLAAPIASKTYCMNYCMSRSNTHIIADMAKYNVCTTV